MINHTYGCHSAETLPPQIRYQNFVKTEFRYRKSDFIFVVKKYLSLLFPLIFPMR